MNACIPPSPPPRAQPACAQAMAASHVQMQPQQGAAYPTAYPGTSASTPGAYQGWNQQAPAMGIPVGPPGAATQQQQSYSYATAPPGGTTEPDGPVVTGYPKI